MKEDEYRRNVYLLQLYQEQIESIYSQVEMIEKLIDEYNRAIETMKEIAEMESKEVLMPLGINVFGYAELKDTNKVVVNIGRSVYMEKTINNAIDFLNKKIEELKKSEEKLAKTAEELRMKMEEIANKLKDVQVS